MRRELLGLLLLVGAPACRSEPPPGTEDTDPSAPGLPGVSLEALLRAAARRPPGQAEIPILDRLSEPERLEERSLRNRHDPTRQDLVRTWVYEGMTLTVYTVTETGRERIQRIEVTGAGYRAPDGLRVGMTREAVVGIRGQPAHTFDSTDVYGLRGEIPGQLRVDYGPDETVRRLTWLFPVD